MSSFRGYEIKWKNDEWVFADTDEPTVITWQRRPCGHCGKYNTLGGHDGCIGYVAGLINACCGHGQLDEAYAQFPDGRCVTGDAAIQVFNQEAKHL